jgi:hypothetical protein
MKYDLIDRAAIMIMKLTDFHHEKKKPKNKPVFFSLCTPDLNITSITTNSFYTVPSKPVLYCFES